MRIKKYGTLYQSIPSNPLDVCSKARQMRVWSKRPSIRSATEAMSNDLQAFVLSIDFKISHKLK